MTLYSYFVISELLALIKKIYTDNKVIKIYLYLLNKYIVERLIF